MAPQTRHRSRCADSVVPAQNVGRPVVDARAVSVALADLAPIIRREAAKVHRTLPASVELDDVEQAARIAAWEAVEKFNGTGNRDAFVVDRIRKRLIDFQRTEHPAGRSGKKIVAVSDDDAMALVAGDDDPAAEFQRRQHFEETMSALPTKEREAITRALAGKPGGPSAAKVAALVEGVRNRTPDSFDPDSVPVLMNLDVPPIENKRPSKFARMLQRLPAGGAYRLGRVQAKSLVTQAKRLGIKYALRADPQSETLMLFFREPSDKQLKGPQ